MSEEYFSVLITIIKTQSEIDVYERQIKSVDGAIDGLVYELYGLTEEEVSIVTNQT